MAAVGEAGKAAQDGDIGDRIEVAAHDDPAREARAAGLRHVSDSEPGLTRRRSGRGFTYRDAKGRVVDARARRRITALAIPPAWRDVWICASPRGHLQATGVDARGRKQYLYHPHWREVRDRSNFDRLVTFPPALAAMRRVVAAQLRRRTADRDRVLAGMVRMLDRTGLRAGNEVYLRENNSIGLATLRWSHLDVTGDTISLAFPAKSGRQAAVRFTDAALARLLREIRRGRRSRVFAVEGAALHAQDLNTYLGEIAGSGFTAKDVRTWRGTVAAWRFLRSLPSGAKPTKKNAVAAIDSAAEALQNTRSVARAHYVHPRLIELYLAGALEVPGVMDDSWPELDDDEQSLAALLPSLRQEESATIGRSAV